MSSLQDQSTGRLVAGFLLLAGFCTWIGLLLFNVRGYGDRWFSRTLDNAARMRRAGFNPTGATADQTAHILRIMSKVILVVLFGFLLVGAVLFAISLVTRL